MALSGPRLGVNFWKGGKKMDKKERYLVTLATGEQATVVAKSFAEVENMLGSENVQMMVKLDYEELFSEEG